MLKIVVKKGYTGPCEIYLVGKALGGGADTRRAEVRRDSVVVASYPFEPMNMLGHHPHIDKARAYARRIK